MSTNKLSIKNLPTEKLQKVLARAGLGSRRQVEVWIKDGRITVNRRTAQLGARVSSIDIIKVDNRLIKTKALEPQNVEVICYNKPSGEICSRSDPEGRATVFQKLPKIKHGRWIAIGRLDLNTSGLLLFTNNGELANKLMHPSQEIEREYAVRILGEVNDKIIENLTKGILLEDGFAKFEQIVDAGGTGANHWYHVILTEGRNREVRRLWESQDLKVSRLIRVRYGAISLPRNLRQGKAEQLDSKYKKLLFQQAGFTDNTKK
jgi:23S rRNA pseudouridine2605 synthase